MLPAKTPDESRTTKPLGRPGNARTNLPDARFIAGGEDSRTEFYAGNLKLRAPHLKLQDDGWEPAKLSYLFGHGCRNLDATAADAQTKPVETSLNNNRKARRWGRFGQTCLL